MRTTIDFGIDLGTTNSAIAMLQGSAVSVFRHEGFDYTPSAVWLDSKDRIIVGRGALEKLGRDDSNVAREFKTEMGKSFEYKFSRNGRKMTAEELAAAVLKSLKASAADGASEEVDAAVITVPADFTLDQVAATVRAAALAGIHQCVTYPEPMAAALAYGFESVSDRVFWLVYDFGGGTFDAAVIQLRDDRIEPVSHGGDRHLGGKLIDVEIVDQILVPALLRERRLTDFHRGNSKWNSAFALLKQAAEEAKIRLSYAQTTEIRIDVCKDDRGELVEFEYELSRDEVARLAEPGIRRTINICKKALADHHLSAGAIERLLLVGGPTLSPYLRDLLADPREGLGIPLHFSIDPMTVVARGAAIFAGTQMRHLSRGPLVIGSGQFVVDLAYTPIGREIEPLVGGKVSAPAGRDLIGFTLEFVNASDRTPWRSGKLELFADGKFTTYLKAQSGDNLFQIELRDPYGTRVTLTPDNLSYRWGVGPGGITLIHSVGVAMANNQVDQFLEKGTLLPARKQRTHFTTIAVRRGFTGDLLRIPVVEGENTLRADRNRKLGILEIHASEIKRDLPVGSEVEILLEIDASRQVRASAFVPILAEEFDVVMSFGTEVPEPSTLGSSVERETARLEAVRQQVVAIGEPRAKALLRRIDEEQTLVEIASSLHAAELDSGAAGRCRDRLIDLGGQVDEIEAALEWPALCAEAERLVARMHEVVREHGEAGDRTTAATLEKEVRRTMEIHDPAFLRLKIEDVRFFSNRLLQEVPGYWISLLSQLKEMRSLMRDQGKAAQLFAQGLRAVASADLSGMRAAVLALIELLPEEQKEEVGYGGTTQSAERWQ